MNRIGRLEMLLLGGIVLFAAAFRLATLNRPFERDPEGCGAFYGLVARNYFRYPISQSRLVSVTSMGQGAPIHFYANHPPTTPLLIAAVHLLTGYHGEYENLPGEWQTRLPAATFTVGCVVLIYVLLRSRSNPRAALIAAALFAVTPMTLYYGGQPDVINTQLVFFALLTVAAYERFSDRPDIRTFTWLVLAFIGAGIMDWPAFYLLPVLGLHYVCTHRPREWGWIIGFGLVGSLVFFMLYAHLAIAQQDWSWMASQVRRRAGGESDASEAFTPFTWIRRALWINRLRHGVILCALLPCWIGVAARRGFGGSADRFTALLIGWAALHVLVGKQGVYQHEWWWWPLTPGLVIAAGLLIDQLLGKLRIGPRPTGALATGVIALLAGWNAFHTMRQMNTPHHDAFSAAPYSLQELGQTIRQNARPDEVVVLAEGDVSLGLWYYADRGLKRNVWDVPTLDRRRTGGLVDLSFDATGQFGGPAAAVIVPKAYLMKLTQFLESLDARYPRRDAGKFLVYDLRGVKD